MFALAIVLTCVVSALPERAAILTEPPGPAFGFTAEGWTPSEADVTAIEGGLDTFFAARPNPRERDLVFNWKSAFRQYGGVIVDKQRLVFVNFACERSGHGGDLRKRWIVVDDGGSCYFNLRWDPKTKRFSDLAVNGEA